MSHFCGFASYLITAWPWALRNVISPLLQNKPRWHHVSSLRDVLCFPGLFALTFHCWRSSRNTVTSYFQGSFPYFPWSVSTNSRSLKKIRAISAASWSRAVPPAWVRGTLVPNGILFSLLCTSLSSYHLHFGNHLLIWESLPKPKKHEQLNFILRFFSFYIPIVNG